MLSVVEIMTTDVQVIGPQETLRKAAMTMRDFDIGSLPVCNGQRLLGMLTDRDITIYGIADGLNADEACVSDVMTENIQFCTADQDVEEVMRLMGEQQIRRLPVIDAERKLIGIVSLGDMAVRQSGDVDETVRRISSPGESAPGSKDGA